MFNLADRASAFYVPIQQQPLFMDSLEDHVSDQLATLLAPSMSSSEIDSQEVVLSIGKAVAESRQIYEKYKFVLTEDTKERNAFFQHGAERIAGKAGDANNEAIISAVPEIAISSGSACTTSTMEPSHVLLALGMSKEEAYSSLRFGIGRFNTEKDVDIAAKIMNRCMQKIQKRSYA